jgi:hypothetical protein
MSGAEDAVLTPGARRCAAVLAVLRAAREHGFTVSRTKVAKLLYLTDLRSVERGGEPVSGVEWKWLQYGPFNNVLFEVERDLVGDRLVECETSGPLGETQVRLVGDGGPFLPELDAELVAELGDLAASSLRDLSYQTPPMLEAKREGRGVVLDLGLVRPLPRVGRTLARLREAARELPEQFDDDGFEEDVLRELAEFRPGLARVNRLIGDP